MNLIASGVATLAGLWLPGFLIVQLLPTRPSPDEAGPASICLSLLFWFVVGLSALWAGASFEGAWRVAVAFTCVLAVAVWHRRRSLCAPTGASVGAFFAYVGFVWGLQACLPHFTVGYFFDWTQYFQNVRLFYGHAAVSEYATGLRFEYLVTRPPLFSVDAALLLAFDPRESYARFCLAGAALNATVYWAVGRLASIGGDGPHRRVVALRLLPFAVAFTLQAALPTPKVLMAAFVGLALSEYVAMRHEVVRSRALWFGLYATTAYLSHPSSVLFFAPIVIDQLWIHGRARSWRLLLDHWVVAAGPAILLVVAWHAWPVVTFGFQDAFRLPYTIGRGPGQAGDVWGYLTSRIEMIFANVVTEPLVLRLRGDPWLDLRDAVVRNQLETVWGAWSTAATVAALVVLIRQKRAPWAAAFQPVLAISAAGALLSELIHFIPARWGGFINNLSPLALTTYVAIAASSLASTSERTRRLVEVLAAAELAVVLACAVSVTLRRISPVGFDFPFQAIGGPRGAPVALGFAVACAAAYQALIDRS